MKLKIFIIFFIIYSYQTLPSELVQSKFKSPELQAYLHEENIYSRLKNAVINKNLQEIETIVTLYVHQYPLLINTTVNSEEDSLLIWATNHFSAAFILKLLSFKNKDGFLVVDVNYQNKSGSTALLNASMLGKTKTISALLKTEASVNHQDAHGQTALIFATENENIQTVQELLQAGAIVNLQNEKGLTAIDTAQNSNTTELIKILEVSKKLQDAVTKKNVAKIEEILSLNVYQYPFLINIIVNTIKDSLLMWAINHSMLELVTKLLSFKNNDNSLIVNVNHQDKFGSTALMNTSKRWQTELAIKLLKAKANVNLQNKEGYTALMLATASGHTEIAKRLLFAGANVDLKNNSGFTVFNIANDSNRREIYDILKEYNNKNNYNYFMLAAVNGNLENIKAFLDAGIDVNYQDQSKSTALMLATGKEHTEIVKQLLLAGANVNLQNNIGNTALMLAIANQHTEIVKQLLLAEANVNLQNSFGNTAESIAMTNQRDEIIQILEAYKDLKEAIKNSNIEKIKNIIINHRFLINARVNQLGYSPLMWAIYNSHTTLVDILNTFINVSDPSIIMDDPLIIDVNYTNILGFTNFMFAALYGYKKIVNNLLKAGSKINYQNKEGNTALMLATTKGHTETVQELLKAQANANLQNKNGQTALDIAQSNNATEIIKILKEYNTQQQAKNQ